MALSPVSTTGSNMSKDLPPAYYQLFTHLPPPYSSLQSPNPSNPNSSMDSKKSSSTMDLPAYANDSICNSKCGKGSTTPIRQLLTFGKGSKISYGFLRPDMTRVQTPDSGDSTHIPSLNPDTTTATGSTNNQLVFASRFGTSKSRLGVNCLPLCTRVICRSFAIILVFGTLLYVILRISKRDTCGWICSPDSYEGI